MKTIVTFLFTFLTICVSSQTITENRGQLMKFGVHTAAVFYYLSVDNADYFFCADRLIEVRTESRQVIRKDHFFTEKVSGFVPIGFQFESNFYSEIFPSGLRSDNYKGLDLLFGEKSGRVEIHKGKIIISLPDTIIEKKIPQRTTSKFSQVALWSTYFGGSSVEDAFSVCVDDANYAYVCGTTSSVNFPASPGSFSDTSSGNYDCFVMKFSPGGNVIWATYFGGSNLDYGYSIQDNKSFLGITGYTYSTDFPVTAGSFQTSSNGSIEAFVFVFDTSGSRIWSTYFGGSGGELGTEIIAAPNKGFILGGGTSSIDLPVSTGAFQDSLGGAMDAFFAVFDSLGNNSLSSYFGGTGTEDVHASVSTSTGFAFTGGTYSNNFPTSSGAWQTVNSGSGDVYIISFDTTGQLIYSTYFGGSANDDASGIIQDTDGNSFIVGSTQSADLPMPGAAYDSTLNGIASDMFLLKLNSSGQALWATYYGGSDLESGNTIHIRDSSLFISGSTASPDFPTTNNVLQSSIGGGTDGFLSRWTLTGIPVNSSFYGGSVFDGIYSADIDSAGNLFIAGSTQSNDLPLYGLPFQSTYGGGGDGFLLKANLFLDTNTGLTSVESSGSSCFIFSENILYATGTISVFDVTGSTVYKRETTLTKEHDLSFLKTGVYLVRCKTGSGKILIR